MHIRLIPGVWTLKFFGVKWYGRLRKSFSVLQKESNDAIKNDYTQKVCAYVKFLGVFRPLYPIGR